MQNIVCFRQEHSLSAIAKVKFLEEYKPFGVCLVANVPQFDTKPVSDVG